MRVQRGVLFVLILFVVLLLGRRRLELGVLLGIVRVRVLGVASSSVGSFPAVLAEDRGRRRRDYFRKVGERGGRATRVPP